MEPHGPEPRARPRPGRALVSRLLCRSKCPMHGHDKRWNVAPVNLVAERLEQCEYCNSQLLAERLGNALQCEFCDSQLLGERQPISHVSVAALHFGSCFKQR
jgi:predicted amidophosphoribosyltransferase